MRLEYTESGIDNSKGIATGKSQKNNAGSNHAIAAIQTLANKVATPWARNASTHVVPLAVRCCAFHLIGLPSNVSRTNLL